MGEFEAVLVGDEQTYHCVVLLVELCRVVEELVPLM